MRTNTRLIWGAVILGMLVLANFLVRLNKNSTVVQVETPLSEVSTITSSTAQAAIPANSGKPVPSTPLEKIKDLRERLSQLPTLLSIASQPLFISVSGRNPFQWVLPPPLAEPVATPTVTASETVSPPQVVKPPQIKVVGVFSISGKKSALLGLADEAFLVNEGEEIPKSTFRLASILNKEVVLVSPTLGTSAISLTAGEDSRITRIVDILSGVVPSEGFPLVNPASFTASATDSKTAYLKSKLDPLKEYATPICFAGKTGKYYHSTQNCPLLGVEDFIPIFSIAQMDKTLEPCPKCWTKPSLK